MTSADLFSKTGRMPLDKCLRSDGLLSGELDEIVGHSGISARTVEVSHRGEVVNDMVG